MNIPDFINGAFEAFGAYSVWANVFKLRRDRDVKGITAWYIGVFSIYGYWNLYYYWHLLQWFSWASGGILAIGNTTWVVLWLKIRNERKV